MVGRSHRVAFTLIALVLSLAPIARAQEDESTTLFREGVAHLRESRYEEAAAAFRASYRLAPRVTTMCNLALTLDRWGPEHREGALRAYRTCAADDDTGQFREYAEERILAIERELVLRDPPEDEEPQEAPPEEEATERADVAPTPVPAASYDHPWAIGAAIAGGLGVAALITGIALALDAQSMASALESDAPSGEIVIGSEEDRRLSQAEAIAAGATAAYVLTGIFGAAAAAFVAIDLIVMSEREHDVRVRTDGRTVRVTAAF